MSLRELVSSELEQGRARSLALLDPLDEVDQLRQHSPLMSPLVWDLAHIGNYEEQWLLGAIAEARVAPELDSVYDAFAHPRRDRPALPLLQPEPARRYLTEVRTRVLDVLDRAEIDSADPDQPPLLRGGFVYGMVVQHEHQHIETMLATLQLRGQDDLAIPDAPSGGVEAALPAEVLVEGGPFEMGTTRDPWAYDNERPAHVVDVAAFHLDTAPVTNGQYLAFMADGGYRRPEFWHATGWSWARDAGVEGPGSWERQPAAGSGHPWARRRFGRLEPLPFEEPVQHVCWYEADAWARWAGRRLPTEAEWEKAASWDAASGRKLHYPWGDSPPGPELATLSASDRWRPAPVGSRPRGVAPCGAHQLIGDVWEWTDSGFTAYPDFRSFPYREYSEVFWGPEYKVLRGGSWATHPSAVRATFRNWDFPIRRQIFAGFRTARDAA